MIRKWLTGLLAAVALFAATAPMAKAYGVSSTVLADAPVLALVPLLAQVKVTQSGGKTYVVESLVVVVLFGAALFAVCKTSRRT